MTFLWSFLILNLPNYRVFLVSFSEFVSFSFGVFHCAMSQCFSVYRSSLCEGFITLIFLAWKVNLFHIEKLCFCKSDCSVCLSVSLSEILKV